MVGKGFLLLGINQEEGLHSHKSTAHFPCATLPVEPGVCVAGVGICIVAAEIVACLGILKVAMDSVKPTCSNRRLEMQGEGDKPLQRTCL